MKEKTADKASEESEPDGEEAARLGRRVGGG